jgi:hypothetical protein
VRRRRPPLTVRSLIALVFCALLCAPKSALAIDDPALQYWTLETAHFKVTYAHPLEPIARRVANLCEAIHARLSDQMQFAPDEKTEILLTDDTDSANGSASPVPYNGIRLFVTAPSDISTLGDYDDWYLELVTHEYVHILHTGNISGVASIANAIFGKTFAPNSAQPRWIIEGLAVVFESENTTGGRIRSSLFDTYLRMDVLEDNVARLDQISSNANRWPYGNLFYLYGSRFLRWIVDIYGPETMPAVSADYGASLVPFGVNRAIRRQTGKTYEELYDAWLEHLRIHYKEQADAVNRRGRREGVRITFHGREVSYPRFVPARFRQEGRGDEVVYFRNDSNETPGIYRFELGDPTESGERSEELIARTNTDATATFTPEGALMFQSLEFWRNLYSRHDLFELPEGERSTAGTEPVRLRRTEGLRARDPDVSPDGRLVTFTVNARGTTRLMIADRSADGALGPARVLVDGAAFDQAYTPRFSPDGTKIAWSAWRAGGFRDVRLVEVATGRVEDITRDRAMDMQPVWSPDGKTIYFSSDRTGIFNVYAFDVGTKTFQMVTNVVGAALTPAVSPDGKSLVYTGYTRDGFDLYAMRLDPKMFLPAPAPPADRPEPAPDPVPARAVKKPYNPLPTLGPQTWFFEIGQGYFGSVAITFTTSGTDIVGHHGISASATFDPDAPEPRGSISYAYSGLPVTLGIDFSRSVVPRGTGYRIYDLEVPFDETRTGLSTSISVPIQRAFVDQVVALSYSATLYHANLPVPDEVDPYASPTIKPDEGFLSQIRASYGLSATETSVDTAGTRSGFAFRVGASMADESLGSTSSLYAFDFGASGYIPMPWPGHQTLALRASGAVSAGSYARRGLYFVGGYDTENTNIFDLVISGVYDGAFVLRGYPPGAYAGSEFLLTTMEYRAPIWSPNWGPSTLPVFLRRIDAAAFIDYGGAFDELDLEKTTFFEGGDLLHIPGLHGSAGLEIWLGLTLAYRVDMNLKLGYAYGFGFEAVEDGQFYFLASSAF